MTPQGVDVQNLVGIDSAVTDLHIREKTLSVYFLLTYLSVLYFVGATDHSFVAILMLNGSNYVFHNH